MARSRNYKYDMRNQDHPEIEEQCIKHRRQEQIRYVPETEQNHQIILSCPL